MEKRFIFKIKRLRVLFSQMIDARHTQSDITGMQWRKVTISTFFSPCMLWKSRVRVKM